MSSLPKSRLSEIELFNWDTVPSEEVSPLQSRKVIHTPKATFVRITSRKGASVPLHHHVHEQVTIMVSGAFRFTTPEKTLELSTGDILRLPSDVPHQAEALEDSITLEIFTPAREDWQPKGIDRKWPNGTKRQKH
jgi:quercetin dioxygenase-like cupin family protein